MNSSDNYYCYSCGALLPTAPSTQTRQLDLDGEDIGQTHFGRYSNLVLRVRGAEEPVIVALDKPELIIGRSAPDSTAWPEVDLTPYDAVSLGVSRQHARLRYEKSTLTITDLGSVNHTFINGQRLHEHEVRVLREGDEVRLGRLVLNVHFKHRVARLK